MSAEGRGGRRTKVPLTRDQRAMVARSTLVPRLALSMVRHAAPLRYDDLVSAGNEALVGAAARFDAALHVPFEAYAYTSVHFAMRKAVAKARREAKTVLPTSALTAGYDALETAEHPASPLDDPPQDALRALDEHCDALAAGLVLGLAAGLARDTSDEAAGLSAKGELVAQVDEELRAMPAARRLVELRYFEGREWNDVATALGCSSATARREHAAALRLLAARLRARGAVSTPAR